MCHIHAVLLDVSQYRFVLLHLDFFAFRLIRTTAFANCAVLFLPFFSFFRKVLTSILRCERMILKRNSFTHIYELVRLKCVCMCVCVLISTCVRFAFRWYGFGDLFHTLTFSYNYKILVFRLSLASFLASWLSAAHTDSVRVRSCIYYFGAHVFMPQCSNRGKKFDDVVKSNEMWLCHTMYACMHV